MLIAPKLMLGEQKWPLFCLVLDPIVNQMTVALDWAERRQLHDSSLKGMCVQYPFERNNLMFTAETKSESTVTENSPNGPDHKEVRNP